MSKLSFRARALDASKPMPIYLAEELPDLPDYSAINRAVPQMPSGMEKEEESEHHLQRAISGTGLIIPTPEVCEVSDLEFYERCYPPDYKMPKQHIHMQPLWEEQEAPEYDIDSEDERWLKQQRHPELTEWKFEQMMDKLEKCSGQTVVTLNEAKLLLERHDDLVTAVYDYWLNKRLTTQHALILSVKTESRPGQSTNNPYLAFRRRTEKMQTRKNRKNDESSYEKMLKLRRDLARALTLLELVARRETAKRELLKLTAQLADKRYAAKDFANQLLPDPPPRPQYTSVTITASSFRAYTVPHYPSRAPPTPVDTPRQREKRPYKRRKYRHPAAASAQGLRDAAAAGVASSSEEEVSPADDGPFAFRRKPGCYYEMPTSTLCGDPLDSDKATKDALYDHEFDERHRFTLTSLNHPYQHCIGFARRRACRGGRVALDRVRTPLEDLWPRLPFNFPSSSVCRQERAEEVELETKAHRTPKEMTRDYHTGGKHPWRHAFRQHLARNPHLWAADDDGSGGATPIKMEVDLKTEPEQHRSYDDDVRFTATDVSKSTTVTDVKFANDVSGCGVSATDDADVKFASVSGSDRARTIDSGVRDSLRRAMRKRAWSGCSDGSYDSDEALVPTEREFERFIDEVNKKWLHFRPKTPPPSPPRVDTNTDRIPIAVDTPIAVELRAELPSHGLDAFTTSEFTLTDLYGDINPEEKDTSATSLDISNEDLLNENLGLTEAQVESILSETDLKALADVDDKKMITDDILELVNDDKDSFLLQGQGSCGRACPGARGGAGGSRGVSGGAGRGSSAVRVRPPAREPMYVELVPEPPPPVLVTPKVEKVEQQPVPTSKIIVEEVNEVPPQIKVERKRKEDTIEEVSLPHGVQLKTVHTKHSPLKKHIITSAAHRRASDTVDVTSATGQPQIVTVAVSESLKVRLQNHLLSTQSGVLVQNGPFSPVAVLPMQQAREGGVTVSTASPRRVSAPLVQLAAGSLTHKPIQLQSHSPLVVASVAAGGVQHVPANKLKVLHAHPLTHAQRAQLLGRAQPLPGVVSLAPIADKPHHQQLYEIKAKQLGKGPHLVNVVRQPQPGKTTVTRLDLNDSKKRQVVFDTTLKGSLPLQPLQPPRPQRLSVSLDARHLVRAAMPHAQHVPHVQHATHATHVRAPHVRHQIQLKNRTLQVATPVPRSSAEPSSSVAAAAATPSKPAAVPHAVVANLLHKAPLPKGGPKLAIGGGAPLAANVQAIAFTAAQLKARQARLAPQRPKPNNDMVVETSTVPSASAEPMDADDDAVRRRDSLPMEVT